MPDVFTQAKRSDVMSRIRSRGNRDTELAVVALFRREGIIGWRRQVEIRSSKFEVRRKSEIRNPKVTVRERTPVVHRFRVRPDFVFRERRLAIFVDGSFWHTCPWHATQPRNRAAFWRRKLAANRERDRRVNRALRAAGGRVLRIWEHALAPRQEGAAGALDSAVPGHVSGSALTDLPGGGPGRGGRAWVTRRGR